MRKVERTISILGGTSVGKSALTIRFVNDRFTNEYDPTIYRSYRHEIKLNGVEYELVLNDTAGLELQPQIGSPYLNSNGYILVYSITDPQSFDIVKNIFFVLSDELARENLPIVLIGNKSDLNDQRRIPFTEGEKLAKSMNAKFYETSARLGENVKEGIEALLNTIDNQNINNNNLNINNNYINGLNNPSNNNNNNNTNPNSINSNANSNVNRPVSNRNQLVNANGGSAGSNNKCTIS